ncbi:hypothetical protein IE81DRAFT_327087 [Ceraceosorus guamensis]|uniref:CS domain-containing protein n=1 Tax=Ceraceosorus guamensis TaxID=1522189 RepID=A0A316VTN6_9BASI|nr:hypothetical protein IE81DRAFT_327087 [Ceraceosorus guamensis]PWN38855.1 hypothetical protein IE81DRAFT_327087 [Ceraceosorus guamensis]
MAPIAPPVFWAQRSSESEPEKNLVLLTIEAPNLPPKPATKVDLQSDGFAFESKVQGDKSKSIEEKEYKFDLKLFGEIVPEVSFAERAHDKARSHIHREAVPKQHCF